MAFFGVICSHSSHSQHQGEVFIGVVFQAGQGLREEHDWHLCIGTVPVAARPQLWPQQMGSVLLAPHSCSSAAAANLISCLGFRPSVSPLGESKGFSCTCVCVLPWDQGAARAAVSLWLRLPADQPKGQRQTHVWLELQHLQPVLSLSA